MVGQPVAHAIILWKLSQDSMDWKDVDRVYARLSSQNNIFIFIMRGLTATCRRTHNCSGSSKTIQMPAVWQDLRCHPRQPRLGTHDCVVFLLSS